MQKLGFLGPEGTYSHLALNAYINGQTDHQDVSYESIPQLFESIQSGQTDSIIVPMENSIEGPVNISLDLLSKYKEISIKSEIILPINNCLLAKSVIELKSIRQIWSHPQPIAQCQKFIFDNCKYATTTPVNSTAVAAQLIHKNNEKYSAIIGNESLAKRHNLHILADNINDYSDNKTSFFVISNDQKIPPKSKKSSIIFTTEKNEPGSLSNVLLLFAESGINLTKILSRPLKSQLGEYIFHIDFEGSVSDTDIQTCISNVQKHCAYFKLLGSYTIINVNL